MDRFCLKWLLYDLLDRFTQGEINEEGFRLQFRMMWNEIGSYNLISEEYSIFTRLLNELTNSNGNLLYCAKSIRYDLEEFDTRSSFSPTDIHHLLAAMSRLVNGTLNPCAFDSVIASFIHHGGNNLPSSVLRLIQNLDAYSCNSQTKRQIINGVLYHSYDDLKIYANSILEQISEILSI